VFLQIAEHCNREQFNALVGSAYPGRVSVLPCKLTV
jgi:hypothetical protein